MQGIRLARALSRHRSSRRPRPLWVAAFALLLLGVPSAARAHNDPPGCSGAAVALEVRVFRDDGVTGVIGAVAENEDIKYQAVLRKASAGGCAFSGGTFTLTLPNGTVETISNDVPCIGGTTSPCVAGNDDLTSPQFDYTVFLADVSDGVLTAAADYTGGLVHDNEPDTAGLSVTIPEQTPVGLCTGDRCANDPPGCSATSVSIEVRVFRADGVTGVVGAVSECESLRYQAVLRKASAGGCALSGGTFTLTLPDGTVETISNDVPCIGGTMSPCVAGNDDLTSPQFDYTVFLADISGGFVAATAGYADGLAHDTNPGTPGVSATTPNQTPVVLCTDNNACTDDFCDSTKAGAAACAHTDVPANPDQPDLDGDGIGDDCDPIDAALNVTQVRLRRDSSATSDNGAIVLKGDFTTQPPADVLTVSAGIGLRVQDALAVDVERSWSSAECVSAVSGRIVCRSLPLAARVKLLPLRSTPGTYRLAVNLKRLNIVSPFAGPVTATLTYGASIDRVGTIAFCGSVNSGLKCTP